MKETSSPGKLYYELGISLLDAGRYQEAVDALNKCLADPSADIPKARAYMALGKSYQALHQSQPAIKAFNEAQKLEPGLFKEIKGLITAEEASAPALEPSSSILGRVAQAVQKISPLSLPTYHKKVDSLMAQGKYEEAEEALTYIIKTWPADVPALEKLGIVLRQQDKLPGSIDAFNRAIKKAPRSASSHLNLGEIYLQTGQYADAIQAFSRALEINPADGRALLGRGKAYRLNGALNESVDDLRLAVKYQPENPEVYSELAAALQASQKPQEAAAALAQGAENFYDRDKLEQSSRLFQMASSLDPKNPQILDLGGRILQKQGRLDEALSLLNQAAELSQSAPVYFHVAQIYYDQDNYTSALSAVEKSLELSGDQKDLQALTLKGAILSSSGQAEEGLKILDSVIAVDANQALFHAERGAALENLNRSPEAMEAYRTALQLDPDYQWAYGRLGSLLYVAGDYKEAIAAVDKAIALKKEAWLYTLKGECLQLQRRYTQAIEAYDRAIEMNPNDLDALFYRGQCFEDLGKYEDALTSVQLVIDLKKSQGLEEDPDDIKELGEILRMLGRDREAKTNFEKAIRLFRNRGEENAWTYAHYGETLRSLSHAYTDDQSKKLLNQAVENFHKSLDLDKDNNWTLGVLGAAHLDLGNYRSALTNLDRSIEINPNDYWPLANKGILLRYVSRYEQSYDAFDRALKLDERAWVLAEKCVSLRLHSIDAPGKAASLVEMALALIDKALRQREDGFYHLQRGICLYLLGQYANVSAEMDKALQLDSSIIVAHQVRGMAWEKLGRVTEAEKEYDLAIDKPDDIYAYAVRAADFENLNAFDRSEADLKKALGMAEKAKGESAGEKDYAECLNNLAWHYAERQPDKLEQALKLSQQAVELSRKLGDNRILANHLDTLGWVHYKRKDYPQAISLLQEAASLDEEDLRIEDDLGEARKSAAVAEAE